MTTKTHKEPTAAQRHCVNRESARKHLQTLLELVESKRDDENMNWGDVGSMAHINDELQELVLSHCVKF